MTRQVLCSNPSCRQALSYPEEIAGQNAQCPRCGTVTPLPPPGASDSSSAARLGHYSLVRKLGEGSMGQVFEAVQDGLNRRVALKVLAPRFAGDPLYLKRFQREAQTAAALNHRHIIAAYEIGVDQGRYFFSMEYVDGETLKARLGRQSRVPPHEALRYLVQSARGLAHAWEHQVIHRDIKPANLMVTWDDTLKIADLGLAKFIARMTESTPTDIIIGTPYYMSPEQARNEDVDIRTDIYSLGATFYHLLTGEVPFKGRSPFETIVKVTTEPFTPILTLNPQVPKTFAAAVEKMMARQPSERFQDPKTLLQELDRVRAEWPSRVSASGQAADARVDTTGVPPIAAPAAPAASGPSPGRRAKSHPWRQRAVERKILEKRTALIAIGLLAAFFLLVVLVSAARGLESAEIPALAERSHFPSPPR
ncbi:MAG: serine/threonine protein kinase [Planctomycetes bacterium]|nr:serine/threonine protein kinase [Planctomycetota bacterium]